MQVSTSVTCSHEALRSSAKTGSSSAAGRVPVLWVQNHVEEK